VTVTVSIGVAGFPDHARTPDRLERFADAALYLAKRQGRNRVELAEPSAVDTTANLPEPPRTVPHQRPPRPAQEGAPADPDKPTDLDNVR
jgi:hypothetical protein